MIKSKNPVSIIMPLWNGATTVKKSLQSIEKQKYPIDRVIIVDNGSIDDSVLEVKSFTKKSKLPIKLFLMKKNEGLGAVFNLGIKKISSEFVILMHTDCVLVRTNEIELLVKPLLENKSVVGSYPTIDIPISLWNTYDFWEKCFFSREVGRGTAGFTTKFDCVRKKTFIQAKGFDLVNFGMGGEDMDFSQKIEKLGKVVHSKAKVKHLHYLGNSFTLKTYLLKRRQYSRAYGRLLRMRPQIFWGGGIVLLQKPILAILPLLPFFHIVGLLLMIFYVFLFNKKMFLTKMTFFDKRILLVPIITITLIYLETYWLFSSFLFGKNKIY